MQMPAPHSECLSCELLPLDLPHGADPTSAVCGFQCRRICTLLRQMIADTVEYRESGHERSRLVRPDTARITRQILQQHMSPPVRPAFWPVLLARN
ncbi:hypothetical protein SAMN05421849_2560 [Pontibaca methylaminivorans]|uniref:Uncharacterized protein n=1 Tax=Pontibaca methylaminivorans TaxID=515897 RepID=A0A1R3X9V3_9RHOB|nr:hypothetical protein SAMN05421849_2560 [Pontibaca methylaminivorans]